MTKPSKASMMITTIAVFLAAQASAASPPSDLHDSYRAVLAEHVDDHGMVTYGALAKDPSKLDAYLARLAALDARDVEAWPARDRIALYLNAYNALTLKAVVDHYPITPGFLASLGFPKNSIRQIAGVWDKLEWTLAGKPVTLDYIEHEILRKRFVEPRIHMALVCAAKGCPALRHEPYTGRNLDTQLEDQTHKCLANRKKFWIDRPRKTVYLSPIFEWFGDDFVRVYGGGGPPEFDRPTTAVLAFIARHLDPADADYIRAGGYDVAYLGYSWSLNER